MNPHRNRPNLPGLFRPASSARRLVRACVALVAVADLGAAEPAASPTAPAPVVQMLVPGFQVQELPVQLRNVNNLVYAPDGRLFALGYDGNVYQLKDSDGDGLEDTATLFFDNTRGEIPPGIGMAWGPGGLYLASRGRILHLRDRGDGTADLQTVTGGWLPPTAAAGSNLDAIGVAVDPAGNIYFGLGCDAWNGAYRVDRTSGVAAYNQFSERGTIIRISADWKRRDIISTGLRFPVSLAFNPAGDLFCSDQEGATWLPNGNPFDELLHIEPGRHYGFPPRHPRHLPGVIDEPSVFDYGPQHQATCGIHFNEPVGGGSATFGPAWWRGDLFVAGESRGKIWRTKLAKSAAGYVAKNDLIACLSMLTIDAVPTPAGSLLVVCHSGAPDWGTGPRGMGKIFRLSVADPAAPQPLLAYAVNPAETRIIFDRAVDPAQWRGFGHGSRIEQGAHVAAGDRFEKLLPGYQAVKDQRRAQRGDLAVLSAGIAPDLHSVVLRSAPRTAALNYAVTLPASKTEKPNGSVAAPLPQVAAIDLLTDLTGVEAEWRDAAGQLRWSGWLPHLDLGVARVFTAASAEHARLFDLLREPGSLTLRAQLDLHLMLRPAVQPGAKLDFEYPAERVTVNFKPAPGATLNLRTSAAVPQYADGTASFTVDSQADRWVPVEVTLGTGAAAPVLDVSWWTAEDRRPRALTLKKILLPWAQPPSAGAPVPGTRIIPEIAGGDWRRGREVFAGNQALCSRCHQLHGEGGLIGPDLSNLVHRDYASVLQDITRPSAAINPDRLAYLITLKDGGSVGGIVLEDTAEHLIVVDAAGGQTTVPKRSIARQQASAVSLMPEGLWSVLNQTQQRDLMTYLLTERPGPKN